MNNSSLSVILSNYNHSLFLEKSVNNILAQSFQPNEIIVIDDILTIVLKCQENKKQTQSKTFKKQ